MPKLCLRTVNVSRAPAPWRFSTIPSKTWIRCRWPSITLKWTRTVSPAMNRGTSRSRARSRLSITLLIGRRPRRADGMLANVDPLGAALDLEDAADQVGARDEPPDPRVAGRGPIVAEQEEPVGRDRAAGEGLSIPSIGLDVRLGELPAVDVDEAGLLGPALAGKADQPLDEDASGPAPFPGECRRVKDDEVAPHRLPRFVGVRRDEIHLRRLAPDAGPRAVQRRLHRRARNAVRPRVLILGAACENDEARRECEPAQHQWNEIRLGGQYVAKTSPIRFLRGTRPHTRESHDELRLSPIIRYIFGGMRVIVSRGGMSASVSVCESRRSGWMYDASSFLPLMYT